MKFPIVVKKWLFLEAIIWYAANIPPCSQRCFVGKDMIRVFNQMKARIAINTDLLCMWLKFTCTTAAYCCCWIPTLFTRFVKNTHGILETWSRNEEIFHKIPAFLRWNARTLNCCGIEETYCVRVFKAEA